MVQRGTIPKREGLRTSWSKSAGLARSCSASDAPWSKGARKSAVSPRDLLLGHAGAAQAVEQFRGGREGRLLLDRGHGAPGPRGGEERLQVRVRLRILPVGAFGCDQRQPREFRGHAL